MNLVEAAMEQRRREQTSMSLAEIVEDEIRRERRGRQPRRRKSPESKAASEAVELPADHYAWSQPR